MTQQNDDAPGGNGRLEGRADGDARVYQAGRDLHVHPGSGALSWKMIVGGVTVAGVLATVIVLKVGGGDGSPSDNAQGTAPANNAVPSVGSSTTPAPSVVAPVTVSPPPTSQSPTADGVRWRGAVNMTYVDLDSIPAHVLSSNNQADFWVNYPGGEREGATLYGQNGGFFTVNPTVAQWDGTAPPSKRQCSERVASQGVESLPIDIGSRYCVQTASNRYAYIVVKGFSDSTGYQGAATVWS